MRRKYEIRSLDGQVLFTAESGSFEECIKAAVKAEAKLTGGGGVPSHTLSGIERYIHERIEPGGFLRAVLENDLVQALGRADAANREALFDIVEYLYNHAPAKCWGSPERVAAWIGKE
jgi:hypothetical protein